MTVVMDGMEASERSVELLTQSQDSLEAAAASCSSSDPPVVILRPFPVDKPDLLRQRATTEPTNSVVASQPSPAIMKKQVSFGSIQVREFNRIAGDHPDCTIGPPLAIDWQYAEQAPVSVDHFENSSKTRRQGVFAMPDSTRREILQHVFRVSEKEIAAAEHAAWKTARKRYKTLKQDIWQDRTKSILKALGLSRPRRKSSAAAASTA